MTKEHVTQYNPVWFTYPFSTKAVSVLVLGRGVPKNRFILESRFSFTTILQNKEETTIMEEREIQPAPSSLKTKIWTQFGFY